MPFQTQSQPPSRTTAEKFGTVAGVLVGACATFMLCAMFLAAAVWLLRVTF